jgi:L-alanine-DL-glutamate epimerase-like enolase superfamily enzyme
MRITDVRATVIGRQEPHSGGSVWTFVRVYTDEGIVGTGECNSAGSYGGFAVKQIVLSLREQLLGQDPMRVGPVMEELKRRGRYGGSTMAPVSFALTGIETALYDIAGKALGVPVSTLLGGRFRDEIVLYADSDAGEEDSVESIREKALEVIEDGYLALKFDADHMGSYRDRYSLHASASHIDHIITMIYGIREAIGPAIDLAIDCHGHFDLPSATTIAKAVEAARLLFFEDPVPDENVEAMAQIRAATSTPICSGENFYFRHSFLELFEKRAVSVIMPDITKAGGLMELKRIADLADAFAVPIAPHNVSSPLGMMAGCHVMATVPNFMYLEFHGRDIAWWSDLCDGDKPFIRKGTMRVSDAPGIGVELNDAVAKKMVWDGDTHF